MSRWGALSLVVAPILLLWGEVQRLGVNTLFADELYYVDFIRLVRQGGDWTPWIWLQHNEHRVIPMKLVMALLAGPTHWSQRAEMFCSVVLSALIVLVLWLVYRSSGAASEPSDLLAFAPLAWLVCSLSQYESQLYGMMMCHFMTALAAVLALWLLARGGRVSVMLAVLTAVLGAFSIANGFLIFPAGIAVLAGRRAGWGRWAAWCLGGTAALAFYLRDYIVPPHTQPFQWTLGGAYKVAKLGFATMGAPLAAGSLAWGVSLGAGLLAVSAFFGLRWLRAEPESRRRDALAIALLLFGLASCAMVAFGRAFLNDRPLLPRYITYTNLAWTGVYLLVLAQTRSGRYPTWRTVAWSLLVPGLLAADLQGLSEARLWRKERLLDQYSLQTLPLQPDAVVSRQFGTPDTIRRAASYLSAERLSAYAEPQRIVMPMDVATAQPTEEILRGQAVEQRLVCPVAELYDVGVMVQPAARPGGSFTVAVTSGGRELARRSFETASLRGSTWVQVPLAKPLARCAGRDLVVRVESADASPGTGVRVLASGPALNAFRFGVLP
ncbi:MAG TPA: hypothetical protein VEW48_15110 [Thermoanaerobaculia bacterium]|nr:hypothetical protein [Thermoanaerobaculia bacterium]